MAAAASASALNKLCVALELMIAARFGAGTLPRSVWDQSIIQPVLEHCPAGRLRRWHTLGQAIHKLEDSAKRLYPKFSGEWATMRSETAAIAKTVLDQVRGSRDNEWDDPELILQQAVARPSDEECIAMILEE